MPVIDVSHNLDTLNLTIVAEFAALVQRIWDLYADPRQLERVWGPPSHPATFVEHALTVGALPDDTWKLLLRLFAEVEAREFYHHRSESLMKSVGSGRYHDFLLRNHQQECACAEMCTSMSYSGVAIDLIQKPAQSGFCCLTIGSSGAPE